MKTLNVAIDSMTVITPVKFFRFYDSSLLDIIQEQNIETGEILSSSRKPVYIEHKGIKLRVFILNLFSMEYISITYSSKMLKTRYLEGINYTNFRDCWQFVKHFLLLDIEYYDYLHNSTVFDCDFKADFYADNMEYLELCTPYLQLPNARKFYSKKESYLSGRKLNGFTLINRKDANISTPFIKFYDKKEELETNSTEFYNYFFNSSSRLQLVDLKRVEVTVKNSKHFDSIKALLSIENRNNLAVLLALSENTKLMIINELLNKYSIIPRDVHRSKSNIKTSPSDWLVLQSFLILMKENKMTFENCLRLLDSYPGLNANTASRIRKRLRESFTQILDLDALNNLKLTAKDAFFV